MTHRSGNLVSVLLRYSDRCTPLAGDPADGCVNPITLLGKHVTEDHKLWTIDENVVPSEKNI